MTYGSIKVNNITYDNNGADVDVAVSSLTSASSLLPLAGGTLTGNLIAKNGVDIHRIVEGVSENAGTPTSAFTIDVNGEVIKYYTSNLTSNFNLNIRGDATTTFDSLLSAGEALTCVLVVTNGATGYFNTGVTIDGASTLVYWNGGAPTSATANCITAYTFTVIKRATNSYHVLASLANFE